MLVREKGALAAPAKLVVAFGAFHMGTSSIFLNQNPAGFTRTRFSKKYLAEVVHVIPHVNVPLLS